MLWGVYASVQDHYLGRVDVHDVLVWPVAGTVEVAHNTPCSRRPDKRMHSQTLSFSHVPNIPASHKIIQ